MINQILKRSVEFENKLLGGIRTNFPTYSPRNEASRILSLVSFEHAESIKMLIATNNFTSATGLLRLQYETFVRALWVFYSATDAAVEKLMTELTAESARKAQNMLMLSKMLEKLEGKAPPVVMEQLLEFKEYSWKPLSSYVHGGIHAIQRHHKGYPQPQLVQAVKASNGLLLMTGIHLTILANDISNQGIILILHSEFKDCLPNSRR